jgi:hypothetical protein
MKQRSQLHRCALQAATAATDAVMLAAFRLGDELAALNSTLTGCAMLRLAYWS